MAVRTAAVVLLAPPGDVWAFLGEPRHLADWWPNVAFVEPDRRGLETGARWRVRAAEATWFRRAEAEDTLLVLAADRERRFAFELVRAKLRAELTLTAVDARQTRADLAVSSRFLLGAARSLPSDALARLHDLVQTGAGL